MRRYAVGIRDGDNVKVLIIKAKSPKDAKALAYDIMEAEGMVSTTPIIDDRNVWTAKPEEKVKNNG